MMALMGLAQSVIGSKQLGAAAPAFTPASSGGVGGLLGAPPIAPTAAQNILGDLGGGSAQSLPSPDLTRDEQDPVAASLKQSSLADIDNGAEKPGGLGGFLGGLDKGLQSPSQVLGLGLLGRINPNLPLAGLLAMGLLNRGR